MKYELRSIGYWSVIKISFVVNLVVGFLVGIFLAIFMSLMMALMGSVGELTGMPFPQDEMPSFGLLIIIYPLMLSLGGAVFNTILLLIIVFIYNIATKVMGGIEIELAEVAVLQPTYEPSTTPPPHAYPPRPETPPPPPPVEPMPPDMKPPDERPPDNSPPRDEEKL